jgi:hypothetical protein
LTCFAWHACTSEVSVSTVVSIRYQKKWGHLFDLPR